jgi:hypothetical protein
MASTNGPLRTKIYLQPLGRRVQGRRRPAALLIPGCGLILLQDLVTNGPHGTLPRSVRRMYSGTTDPEVVNRDC